MCSVEEQRRQQGYFVRLGSLSVRLRHLAYEHSLGKLRQSKHRTQDTLTQLQETLELVSRWVGRQRHGGSGHGSCWVGGSCSGFWVGLPGFRKRPHPDTSP